MSCLTYHNTPTKSSFAEITTIMEVASSTEPILTVAEEEDVEILAEIVRPDSPTMLMPSSAAPLTSPTTRLVPTSEF